MACVLCAAVVCLGEECKQGAAALLDELIVFRGSPSNQSAR